MNNLLCLPLFKYTSGIFKNTRNPISIFLLITLIFAGLSSTAQNTALGFNGTGSSFQYAQVPLNNALDLSGSFTIETWIFPTGNGPDATEGGIIINKENSYEIARFANGTIQFALSANGMGSDWSWINTSLVAPLNQWSHIAFVKSGTTVNVFLNGGSPYVNTSQPATLAANTQNLLIGDRNTPNTRSFQGKIDELRIWNIVRTQIQLLANMFNQNLALNATGLVAYYRMNEGSGTTCGNSCTNTSGIDGLFTTTTGSSSPPSWVTSPIQYAQNSLNFDGVDDFVTIPHQPAQDISSAITIEAWCYLSNNTRGTQNVVSKSSNSQNTGYIFPRTDDAWGHVEIYLHIGGWKVYSAPAPALNTWHHFAATYDGAQVKIYIDGILVTTASQTGSITTNSNALTLGEQPGYPEYFGGSADEIRIWNIARTQLQIQNNMSTEIDPVLQTNLVSYYTFNQGVTNGDNTGLVNLADQNAVSNGTLNNFALAGTVSNFLPQSISLIPLPLQWLGFTVQPQNNTALLEWSTASEENTRSFVIQHSVNEVNWDSIGVQFAAGNSSTERDYHFVHGNPVNGINYYRILQTDLDNHSSYSVVRSVQFNLPNPSLLIFNNPVTNSVLQLKLNMPAQVLLYSNDGKLLWQNHLSPGTSSINMSGYAKGSYLLKANDQAYRIVVQ